MKIGVIGSGKMRGWFAKALAPKHEVAIGSREPERGSMLAKKIGAAKGGSYADAAVGAEVVFLTVPWPAVDGTLAELGDLVGKVLIDVTNPYVGGKLQLHQNSSNAEEIQRKVPKARVVKGWNTIFAPAVNSSPVFDGQAASVFLASDDGKGKEIVATVARDMGFDPVGAGPLAGGARPGGPDGAHWHARPHLRVRELGPPGRPPLTAGLRYSRLTDPSSCSFQAGLCAISHGWPSGSTNTPECPPQNVFPPGRGIVAPACLASSMIASTSFGEPTLWASVTPPHPPPSWTPLSFASFSLSQSATMNPPAWKKTTSSAGCGPALQPSAS